MEMWHFKEEDEDEDIEKLDLLEEETEPLENMIDESSFQPSRDFNREKVNPFLESEPIDNLEQGLAGVQTLGTEDNEDINAIGEQPSLYNAPQYSGGYDSNNYENKTVSDVEMDISGGALTTRDTEFHQGAQRTVDVGTWQQRNNSEMQAPQQQYQAKQPERFKQQEVLPFDVGESIRKL